MVHRRLVYIYLLNVPSFSSRYFNKIKRTSHLGRLLALSLEILYTFKSWTLKRLCDFGSLSVQTFYILRDVYGGWPRPLLTYYFTYIRKMIGCCSFFLNMILLYYKPHHESRTIVIYAPSAQLSSGTAWSMSWFYSCIILQTESRKPWCGWS